MFFENSACLRCGSKLGFDSEVGQIVLIDPSRSRCANAGIAACNWLVPMGATSEHCRSCALTRTRPGTSDPEDQTRFVGAESAKRRLVFQLLDLHLPVVSKDEDPDLGVAFDMLSSWSQPVTTGHDDGVITLDLAEGDDAHRERMRHELSEPYRTVLGHLRHETAHHYWRVLVDTPGRHQQFRTMFGDERADYAAALDHHYRVGPPPGWQDSFVSAYAAAHPWEDWAETFAHYLHVRDTLQTAASFGVIVTGPAAGFGWLPDAGLAATPSDLVDDDRFERILDDWLPLTYALNALNRSMGRDDLYPFVLSSTAVAKLSFVHALVRGAVP